MPNHITNTLEIRVWHNEDKEAISKVLKLLRDEDSESEIIDFAAIIKEPDNLFKDNLGNEDRDRCVREGIPNWYDWNCENWGTKWNAYAQSIIEQDDDMLQLRFDTAWSPPTPVIEALRDLIEKHFPEEQGYDTSVRGSWVEEGYQSAGVF
jgi:hypothetical protein